MFRIELIIAIVVELFSLGFQQRLAENDLCGEGRTRGVCKLFEDCSIAKELIKNRQTPPPLCGFRGRLPIICCPFGEKKTTYRPKPISQKKCEEYAESVYEMVDSVIQIPGAPKENISHCAWTAEELIVGGKLAKPKVYPHMALIGFGSRKDWECGGSLISTRFVLSAAHCNKNKIKQLASWVRLGELDLSRETDEADPKDFRIIERFIHPNYSTRYSYNDIILFKLDSEVEFSPFIRPICLHNNDDIDTAKIKPIVTGWGLLSYEGNRSPELMSVQLGLVDSMTCKQIYGRPQLSKSPLIPDGIDAKTMLCAGGVVGEDSCSGDSGGPLQIPLNKPACMFSQIGVVSFGARCAISIPGVYTRVSYYIKWIESIAWP